MHSYGMLWEGGCIFYRAMHPYGMLQKRDGIFQYDTTLPNWLVAPGTSQHLCRFRQTPPDRHFFVRKHIDVGVTHSWLGVGIVQSSSTSQESEQTALF